MKRVWTAMELTEHWTLLPDEFALLGNKTGATRLGFALLLKAFQLDGRFPMAKHDIPGMVVAHVAQQVNVPPLAYLAYDWPGRLGAGSGTMPSVPSSPASSGSCTPARIGARSRPRSAHGIPSTIATGTGTATAPGPGSSPRWRFRWSRTQADI